jgi:membrane associated rhomboid family serine protease
MIPLRDENPARATPFVTLSIIAINLIVFFHEVTLPEQGLRALIFQRGLVPENVSRLLHGDRAGLSALSPFVTSMFLHGDVLHVAGNMLFLWVFGNNVEDALGKIRYILFYFACGIAAALTQIAARPDSTVPMIGASGAIAGVLGAYLLLYPRARVLTLVPCFFIYMVRLPAFVVLGMWFVYQVLYSMSGIGRTGGGVAFFAHIGGFIAGMVLLFALRPRWLVARARYSGGPG